MERGRGAERTAAGCRATHGPGGVRMRRTMSLQIRALTVTLAGLLLAASSAGELAHWPWLGALARALLWLSMIWLCAGLLGWAGGAAFRRRAGHAAPALLLELAALGVWLLGLVLMSVLEFGLTPSTAFATSGVVLAVVGFAVRALVADLFYGLTMAVERPFEIGHWVKLDNGVIGQVTTMTWRAVKLLTRDNLMIVVPNAELAAAQIINYDLPTPAWRQRLRLALPLHTDPARVHRLLHAVVQEVAECAALPHAPEARIESIGAAVAHWELRFWVPDYAASSRVTQQVQEALLRHLRGAGLQPATERDELLVGSLLRQRGPQPDADRAWLDGVGLFDALHADERRALAATSRRLTLHAGDDLVRQGEDGASMFVLVEGTLEVWMAAAGAEAGAACISRLGPGTAVGEMSLLTGAPRSATLRAATTAVLQEIRRDDLAPLLGHNPALAERFAEVLADRRLADERRAGMRTSTADPQERQSSIAALLRRARQWFALSEAPAPRD